MNRQINHDYGILGELFQAIIDPGFRTTGASEAYPAWFVFAAFASHAIGQAQLGAEVGLDAARFYQESGDHRAAVARSLPGPLVEHAALLVDALLYEDARLAATFLVGFASAGRHLEPFRDWPFRRCLIREPLGSP